MIATGAVGWRRSRLRGPSPPLAGHLSHRERVESNAAQKSSASVGTVALDGPYKKGWVPLFG